MALVTVCTPDNRFLGTMSPEALLAVVRSQRYDRLQVCGLETMSGEVVDDELPVDEIEDIVLKASFGTLDRAESQLVGV